MKNDTHRGSRTLAMDTFNLVLYKRKFMMGHCVILTNMTWRYSQMKTRVCYGSNEWTFEGENIQKFIENNFTKLDDVIKKHAGNTAGYILDTVYAIFDEKQCAAKLCVFAHGSDGLSGYDPTKGLTKELDFQLIDLWIQRSSGTILF